MPKSSKAGHAGFVASPPPIWSVSVEGFKSLTGPHSVEVRPLTVLAGANSSGKSSMLQPLLLLKQTLESAFDPGPLLLNGPHVEFSSVEQFICKPRKGGGNEAFSFGVALDSGDVCVLNFRRGSPKPVELVEMILDIGKQRRSYREGETSLDNSVWKGRFPPGLFGSGDNGVVRVSRTRCFFDEVVMASTGASSTIIRGGTGHEVFEDVITRTIHVPGLRGNPRRTYQVTAVGDRFPGPFETYVASVIAASDQGFLGQLGKDLQDLGLTWKVEAKPIGDTQVELRVGRLLRSTQGGSQDLVSIADVGFGVSQTLPVVVALLTAKPGQLVYIEQPEIHLHPRAQHAMAGLLVRAANRGVRVVTETHSSILILGLQSAVARGDIDPGVIKLHWFARDEKTGATRITSADVDEAGAFPDWPEDFDDVSLKAQQEYLDAADKKLAR